MATINYIAAIFYICLIYLLMKLLMIFLLSM